MTDKTWARADEGARTSALLLALLCGACSDPHPAVGAAATAGAAGVAVAAAGGSAAGAPSVPGGSGGKAPATMSGGVGGVANAAGTAGSAGGGAGGGGSTAVSDPGTEGDGDFVEPAPYEYGPDSERKPGVPEGTVTSFDWNDSAIFPGTQRKVYVYEPAQYDPTRATAVMVFQDGSEGWAYLNGDYRPAIVMDNLIAKKEIPVLIGVFIDHSDQRSFEYDSVTPLYGRFVIEEILPEVAKSYNLTTDPEGRAAVGESSGGIAAFGMGWWWPNEFRRILSNSGSFVNINDYGGDTYKNLVLQSEPKRLRIYMQDGANDLKLGPRMDWAAENQALAAALKTKGYHYRFVFGDDQHGGIHGAVDFPSALRWLWRGYPAE